MPPFAFSADVVADLQLDDHAWLVTIAGDAKRERRASTPLHVTMGRLARLLRPATPAQRAVEADADALAAAYGNWHGQRIAAHCALLEGFEAGRSQDTWQRIAHELSRKLGA